jgi:hypothetical protein
VFVFLIQSSTPACRRSQAGLSAGGARQARLTGGQVQHSTPACRRSQAGSTFNIQHSTFNIQHSTLKIKN